jgi:hypothetical protein
MAHRDSPYQVKLSRNHPAGGQSSVFTLASDEGVVNDRNF